MGEISKGSCDWSRPKGISNSCCDWSKPTDAKHVFFEGVFFSILFQIHSLFFASDYSPSIVNERVSAVSLTTLFSKISCNSKILFS